MRGVITQNGKSRTRVHFRWACGVICSWHKLIDLSFLRGWGTRALSNRKAGGIVFPGEYCVSSPPPAPQMRLLLESAARDPSHATPDRRQAG